MRLRVAEVLPASGQATHLRFTVAAEGPDDGPAPAGPARASLRLERVGDLVRVRGEAEAVAQGACDRCLGPARVPLRIPIDEQFALTATASAGEELTEASFVTPVGAAGEVDLGAVVREHVIAGLPMQLLCGDACRGLCAVCGTNLNEHECGHAATAIDPRLAALGRLLHHQEE